MEKIANLLRGMAIGIAEVIPGVSGGTIAFITGIYEKLIETIKAFNLPLAKNVVNGQIQSAWNSVDGPFLISLLIGMVSGLVIGVLVISSLLESHPPVVWGFFFGLITASVWYILKRIDSIDYKVLGMLIAGSVVAYYITVITPAEGSSAYTSVFIAGSIAVCALILPGISGSFILLLMGMYTIILGETRNFIETREFESLVVIIVFGVGALMGLLVFVRVVSWLLKQYKGPVFGLLCGFMIGSLNKIWPWRDPYLFMDRSGEVIQSTLPLSGDWRVIAETNKLPIDYISGDPFIGLTILFAILGFVLILVLDRIDVRRFKAK
ncbi:MAG: DUF368 domain-containing protein [Saprospirales bacterium]|nr:MAG: DUF368 domain-containing protein [Saprospirales bacterium]